MNRQEYYDYLREIIDELWENWPQGSTDLRGIMFKLTASPYHYWLGNRAVVKETSPPPPGDGSPSIRVHAGNESVLIDKVRKVREFIRANVNDTEHKHLTKSARNALLMLLDGRMLADVPDKEVVEWHENWVVAVK